MTSIKPIIPNLLLFTSQNDKIKNMIINSASKLSQNKSSIINSVRKFDFGFISFTEHPRLITIKQNKNFKQTINGVILCSINPIFPIISVVMLYVSNAYDGADEQLLEKVIQYVESDPNILCIESHSLPKSLVHYTKHNFIIKNIIRSDYGEIKSYYLTKNIHQKYEI